MQSSPKLHQKLTNSKEATVSLNSLLGILSSAYGTEELDSKTVFQENTVNWDSISVENFAATVKKEAGDADREKKKTKISQHDLIKINATTSTTSLKQTRESKSDLDVTLISIKSLETFKQPTDKSETKLNKIKENFEKKEESLESRLIHEENESQNEREPNSNNKSPKSQIPVVVCGFSVEDSNRRVVLDIKFTKKIQLNLDMPCFDLGEPEVSLNLLDVSKETIACVQVPKSCLLTKMKYFAEIEEMFGLDGLDVSVTCSLSVFQWILQWCKADIAMCRPSLNVANLKTILCISYHLGIDLLAAECLEFFHTNCKTVLESEWDIEEVFNDELCSKLVKLFSQNEINAINDYFDSFKSRLYCSLISLLVEPDPDHKIGHHSSLARIFQCEFCDKLLSPELANSVYCVTNHNQFDKFGKLIPLHKRSTLWDLSKFIQLMYEKIKCWKLVYWKLWGSCHFLFCKDCEYFFPLEQFDWCLHHPEEVDYFPLGSDNLYPIGSYKCCGMIAYRFNTLNSIGGCKFKPHAPSLTTEDEIEVYQMYETFKHFISTQPPEITVTKKFVELVKESPDNVVADIPSAQFWWQGILLAPKEKEDYSMVPQDVLSILRNKTLIQKAPILLKPLEYKMSPHFSSMPSSKCCKLSDKSKVGQGMTSVKSKKSKPKTKKIKSNPISPGKCKIKKKESYLYQPTESFWNTAQSNIDNQDNQRDFEEIAMRKLVKMLSPESPCGTSSDPTAGSYIRLESNWWQENIGDLKMAGTSKSSGTVVNRTFPLSWFRKVNN